MQLTHCGKTQFLVQKDSDSIRVWDSQNLKLWDIETLGWDFETTYDFLDKNLCLATVCTSSVPDGGRTTVA